ncbi:MAG: hypothetical protein WCK90_01225 [archaeon]
MLKEELEKKYGKKVIAKVFKGHYLDGCTIAIRKDGKDDIPEVDIINALKEMKGLPFVWD